MSARAVSEATGKRLLNEHLTPGLAAQCRFAEVSEAQDWDGLVGDNPWVKNEVSDQLTLR